MTTGSKHLPFSNSNILSCKFLLVPGALWDTTPMRQMWRARHRRWGVLPAGSSLIPELFVTVCGGRSGVAQPLQLCGGDHLLSATAAPSMSPVT